MGTILRVHTLAKELGITSKVLIEKCHAEGIELKNHMAAVSAGLAESIREWFSVGSDVTSVEIAERVDLAKVQRRPRKRAGSSADGAESVGEAGGEGVAGTAVAEDAQEIEGAVRETAEPAEAEALPAVATALPAEVEPAVEVAEVAETPAEPPPAEIAAAAPSEEVPLPAEAEQLPAAAEPVAPASPPAPVAPAGPQLVPKPAELQGPRVIRVEAPEPVGYPRPRPGIAARAPGERSVGAASPAVESPARRGRGKGRRGGTEEESAQARSRSPRRHGTVADVDQRVREWRDQDLLERKERLASVTGHGLRDRRAAERRRQQATVTGPGQLARKEPVALTVPVTVKGFCSAAGIGFATVSRKLMEQTGRLWTINQSLDAEQVELLAMELGVPVTLARSMTAHEVLKDEYAQRGRENLRPRPPVVAMLGHVDHGKTSLLDAIRRTNVAAGEAGGITQHIGAYRITRGGWDVTFVDTPGHQAFTEMRARGANLTDVVVLVVAADDGVMPQTIEAINHARAAGVTIVVALNKIDLPGVDENRIFAQLAEHGLTPTAWGGNTDVIRTSATTGQGIDELIAHLSTLSELLELQADPDVPAQATVVEAQMREGQGVVAQVLVREGTLEPGQVIVCGPGAGRIRALLDDAGRPMRSATPGTPVQVAGLDELPRAGDQLYALDDLSRAKDIADETEQLRRAEVLASSGPARPRGLEALVFTGSEAEIPELKVILRADVQGSVEVLSKSLATLPAEKVHLGILHAGVGAATEADVHLARASGALIIGFNVVAEERARQLADQLGVEIRQYRVIYEVMDDLHKALAGLLAPVEHEEQRGTVEVRQVFHISRVGSIAGCYVTDGIVHRNHRVRLVRDGRIVVEGAAIGSLKRFKDDAREVRAGFECGIKIDGYDDVKPGDVIQAYEVVEVAQEL